MRLNWELTDISAFLALKGICRSQTDAELIGIQWMALLSGLLEHNYYHEQPPLCWCEEDNLSALEQTV